VITYGHTNGMAYVVPGQSVNPFTLISGVGNMGGFAGSGEIDHIHLEVRGPNGWYGGPSLNPFNLFSEYDQQLLIDIAKNQTNQPEMGKFTDGTNIFDYPPPPGVSPNYIYRTGQTVDPFYTK
jgi:hypothetical protein